jgi:hypothetical protein
MNRIVVSLLSSVFFLGLFASTASADCQQMLKEAAEQAAKDKDCQGDAKNLGKAFAAQFSTCKDFRSLKKACHQAKKKASRTCKATKRSGKSTCRNAKRDCRSKCQRGRKGRSCRKSCNSAKRNCMKTVHRAKRSCTKASRKQKRACKNEAKTTQEFAICKDARKITRKAAGNALKCAGKYFAKPAAACVAELFAGGGK